MWSRSLKWLMSHQTIQKALIFFLPNTAFSAQDTMPLALFFSWAIFVHMLLLLLTAFNTTLTMLCSSCFFHKQKLECLTQHRLLSSTLNPNMWTEAEKEWDEEKKQGWIKHRPISVFLIGAQWDHTLHIQKLSKRCNMHLASLTGMPHKDAWAGMHTLTCMHKQTDKLTFYTASPWKKNSEHLPYFSTNAYPNLIQIEHDPIAGPTGLNQCLWQQQENFGEEDKVGRGEASSRTQYRPFPQSH